MDPEFCDGGVQFPPLHDCEQGDLSFSLFLVLRCYHCNGFSSFCKEWRGRLRLAKIGAFFAFLAPARLSPPAPGPQKAPVRGRGYATAYSPLGRGRPWVPGRRYPAARRRRPAPSRPRSGPGRGGRVTRGRGLRRSGPARRRPAGPRRRAFHTHRGKRPGRCRCR